jgi:hypothetical protein
MDYRYIMYVSDTYCEQVFDGLMCWPATKAGTISVQKCATYVHKFSDKGLSMIIICFFTQWWSTISQEYQQQEQSPHISLIINKTMTFDVGFLCPVLEQTQKVLGLNLLMDQNFPS